MKGEGVGLVIKQVCPFNKPAVNQSIEVRGSMEIETEREWEEEKERGNRSYGPFPPRAETWQCTQFVSQLFDGKGEANCL